MPYCPDCGHDLRTRPKGRPCPECGGPALEPLDAPARSVRSGVLATLAVLASPVILFVPWREPIYLLLVAAIVGWVVLAFVSAREWRWLGRRRTQRAIVVSGVAMIHPVLTLVVFTLVFLVGRSSNVAQLAGSGGYDWWGLWFDFWMPALLATPVAGLVVLVALILRPWNLRDVTAGALPLSAAIAVLAAGALLVTYFPDA